MFCDVQKLSQGILKNSEQHKIPSYSQGSASPISLRCRTGCAVGADISNFVRRDANPWNFDISVKLKMLITGWNHLGAQ